MALFVNQNDSRTKLQERVTAELADKAKKKSLLDDQERPDGVTDSNYLKNTKQTTSLAWVWVVIGVIAVGLVIGLIIRSR